VEPVSRIGPDRPYLLIVLKILKSLTKQDSYAFQTGTRPLYLTAGRGRQAEQNKVLAFIVEGLTTQGLMIIHSEI
jgi:hypothetical protein